MPKIKHHEPQHKPKVASGLVVVVSAVVVVVVVGVGGSYKTVAGGCDA